MLNLRVDRMDHDLGPKQLAWLREKVPGFDTAKRQADAALQHAAEVASKIEAAEVVQ